MNPFRQIYSGLISALIIGLTSCGIVKMNHSDPNYPIHPDFGHEKVIYKVNIQYRSQEISGQMMLKPQDNGTIRLAFYNEIGLSFLEASIYKINGKVKLDIKDIADFLDYKPFLKNLERGLGILLTDKETGELVLPEIKSLDELVYKKGNKFILKIELAH